MIWYTTVSVHNMYVFSSSGSPNLICAYKFINKGVGLTCYTVFFFFGSGHVTLKPTDFEVMLHKHIMYFVLN